MDTKRKAFQEKTVVTQILNSRENSKAAPC